MAYSGDGTDAEIEMIDLLESILIELKLIKMHNEVITEEIINDCDIED